MKTLYTGLLLAAAIPTIAFAQAKTGQTMEAEAIAGQTMQITCSFKYFAKDSADGRDAGVDEHEIVVNYIEDAPTASMSRRGSKFDVDAVTKRESPNWYLFSTIEGGSGNLISVAVQRGSASPKAIEYMFSGSTLDHPLHAGLYRATGCTKSANS